MAGTTKTKTEAPVKATKTAAKAVKEEAKGSLSSPKVGTRLKKPHDVIEKHETVAKEARTERDHLILEEVNGGASVSAVAEAAGVTRQHIYKNIIDKKK